jgi:RNA polymerase sigma factor (sigma-70 family)
MSDLQSTSRDSFTNSISTNPGKFPVRLEPFARLGRRQVDLHDGAGLEQEVRELVIASARRDNGSERAFVELIRQFEPLALAIALAICGRSDGAAEVVQEAFLRAWKRLADLEQPGRFGPWLMQIVRNLAKDEHRRNALRKSEPTPEMPDPRAVDPYDGIDRRESAERLREAIEKLDEISQQIVGLRYFQNLGSREIGQLLDLSATAVNARLCRARQFLRERLDSDAAPGKKQQ